MIDFRVGQMVGYSFGVSDNDEYGWAPERGSIGRVLSYDGDGARVEWNSPIPKHEGMKAAYYYGSRLHPIVSMGGF